MEISLFNSDRECYLWTRAEIEEAGFNFDNDGIWNTTIKNHNIKLVTGNITNGFTDKGFLESDISELNVLLIRGALQNFNDGSPSFIDLLLQSIQKYSDKRFVIITKHPEDYWLDDSLMQSDNLLLKIRDGYPNVRVIWDIDLPEYRPVFHFHPKMVFHHYHNNEAFSGGHVFENLVPVWKKLGRKKFRMGYHVSKVTTELRKYLFRLFRDMNSPHLFFTYTKEFNHTPFDPTISIHSDNINGSKGLWYIKQFVDLTVESDMEVVYETSTMGTPFVWLHKWTEKTIKLLMLGKPFIHADPIAHCLMRPFGMKPYETLYTPELLSFYNGFDYKVAHLGFDGVDRDKWFCLLKGNIEWLLSLSEEEWNWRIEAAYRVADINQTHYKELVYNTSLLPLITSAEFWNV